jgi:hypothetical protein
MKHSTGIAAALLLSSLLALAATSTVRAGSAEEAAVAALELRDQDGQPDSLLARRGRPALVVVVGVRRLPMIEAWERDLEGRVPGSVFLNVADPPAGARVDPTRIAATLRKRVPQGVRVLVDVERRWATVFGLDTALPNLLLFDADGRLVARHRGRCAEPLASEVRAAWVALHADFGAAT